MTNKNMSDMIEEYLKKALQEEGKVKIQRNEVATLFDCVPSQINYVINSRFTIQHGYAVESKRGGGGYIRIIELQVNNNSEQLEQMDEIIGSELSEKDAQVIINTLYQSDLMTEREAHIMLAAMNRNHYIKLDTIDDQVRANILLSMVQLLILSNN